VIQETSSENLKGISFGKRRRRWWILLKWKLSSIALGYGLDDRGFESWQGLGIFMFTTASRPALGPTQSPIQRVPGALSLEVRLSGREAPSSAVVKNA
jgi:hypothetical protein